MNKFKNLCKTFGLQAEISDEHTTVEVKINAFANFAEWKDFHWAFFEMFNQLSQQGLIDGFKMPGNTGYFIGKENEEICRGVVSNFQLAQIKLNLDREHLVQIDSDVSFDFDG